jgi:hypothetical protein
MRVEHLMTCAFGDFFSHRLQNANAINPSATVSALE